MPSLKVARKLASSCCLDGCIYVVSGAGYKFTNLNSIEKLVIGSGGVPDSPAWELITMPESSFTRDSPCVASLDQHTIAILGGLSSRQLEDPLVTLESGSKKKVRAETDSMSVDVKE